MSLGIAVAAGTFKGVFAHGALAQFEAEGVKADIYGSSSSSVLSCSLASIGEAQSVGVNYWLYAEAHLHKSNSLSDVVQQSIAEYAPMIKPKLFSVLAQRLIVAASYVNNAEAASLSQGAGAKKLGRKLMISAMRRDDSWINTNLTKHIFDSRTQQSKTALTDENYAEVAYASTRMLHAWDIAAWIGSEPYVDGSYTCSCPAYELAELGCNKVIAIGVEQSELFTNIFRKRPINSIKYNSAEISVLRPSVDLRDFGVDYEKVERAGLQKAFDHGRDCAKLFLDNQSGL